MSRLSGITKSNWKYRKLKLVFLFVLAAFQGLAQDDVDVPDSSVYTYFRDHWVWYSDVGFSTAPFSLKYTDSLGNGKRLYFRNNSRPSLGFGFSYKWASLRIGFGLPIPFRSVDRFGKSNNFDLGFRFKTKKRYMEVSLHNYKGYAIKNAVDWDTTSTIQNPHLIRPNTAALSLSFNNWRFFDKQVNMSALAGRRGVYHKRKMAYYLKTSFNLFGVSNNGSLVPDHVVNKHIARTGATTISAFDVAFVPGVVFVDRKNRWQYACMFGAGMALQSKFYYLDQKSNRFLGIAPRMDTRILLGYHVSNYFLNLVSEFDSKSVWFQDLSFRQTFYTIRLVGGFRIAGKKSGTS